MALTVVSGIDAMLGYWDKDLRCRFANSAYQTWFGRSPNDLRGLPMQELLGPLFELNLPYIRSALQGEVQVFERAIPLPDGTVRHTIASYYPDVSNRTVNGFSAHVTDVTRMKKLELELTAAREQAEHQATHDYLTGLPNRVLLTDRIAAAVTRAKMTGGLAAVVAIDFDGFKMVNDRYGHDMGDHVLKEIGRRMQRATRATDTVTRLGGDEFIFLASELNACDDLQRAVNRLRLTVGQPIIHQRAKFQPSFCCGIAVYPWHGSSPIELLALADRALYVAKRKGPGKIAYARTT
jgi:diguanylate cyclase (GGDEF)-like protein/PAS domain S-box-containing protein